MLISLLYLRFLLQLLSCELLAPEAKLLEAIDVGALVAAQIWDIKLLEKVSILVLLLCLSLDIVRACSPLI